MWTTPGVPSAALTGPCTVSQGRADRCSLPPGPASLVKGTEGQDAQAQGQAARGPEQRWRKPWGGSGGLWSAGHRLGMTAEDRSSVGGTRGGRGAGWNRTPSCGRVGVAGRRGSRSEAGRLRAQRVPPREPTGDAAGPGSRQEGPAGSRDARPRSRRARQQRAQGWRRPHVGSQGPRTGSHVE